MRWIVLASFALTTSMVFSQRFSSKTSKEKLEIGEAFELLLELPVKENLENYKIVYPQKLNAIRPSVRKDQPDTVTLDLIGKTKDTVVEIQGKFYTQIKYNLLCLDTGLFFLKMDSISFQNKLYPTDPVVFQVHLVDVEPKGDIKDIRESFAELPGKWPAWLQWLLDNWYWILLGLLLSYLGFKAYHKWKRKKEDEQVNLTHREKALEELRILYNQRLWEQGELSTHFEKAILVLKKFLGSEFNRSLLERTTFDILFIAKNAELSSRTVDEMALLLEVSDLVKFAQSHVGNDGVIILNEKMEGFILNFEQN